MSTPSQNGEPPVRGDATRQMAGHLLFEISTEVANRGMSKGDIVCDCLHGD